MYLQVDAKETLVRLKKAESSRSGVAESEELEKQRQELDRRNENLRQSLEHLSLLNKYKVGIKSPKSAALIKEKIQTTITQFRENPKPGTLKTGSRLLNLLKTIDQLNESITDSKSIAWKQFFPTLFGGLSPNDRKSQIALTPKNQKAIDDYSNLYNQFIQFRNRIPLTSEEFVRLNKIATDLRKITFDENVPINVKRFFDATSSSQGATLDLLTSDVIDWLTKNNLIDKYVVRAHRE